VCVNLTRLRVHACVCARAHVRACVRVSARVQLCVHACARVHACVRVSARVQLCVRACVRACVRVCVRVLRTCSYACSYARVRASELRRPTNTRRLDGLRREAHTSAAGCATECASAKSRKKTLSPHGAPQYLRVYSWGTKGYLTYHSAAQRSTSRVPCCTSAPGLTGGGLRSGVLQCALSTVSAAGRSGASASTKHSRGNLSGYSRGTQGAPGRVLTGYSRGTEGTSEGTHGVLKGH
jgi:hypothetical protein